MQLLRVTLYHADGRTRSIDFRPGELNIVTGQSQTGKSALLTIVDYCLGRDSMLVPVGPISDTVAWYTTLWQLTDTRAFVARPAPERGKASTRLAMLEFGARIEPPPLADLQVNSDTRSLREQLGRHIGIQENLTEPGAGSLRKAIEANIGHAALLCLQGQNEIGSSTTLFHRQNDAGMSDALKDTLPYFLGAVAHDQARKRAQLRDAKRTLSRLTSELERAEIAAQTIDVELSALLTEAQTVGLLGQIDVSNRAELVRALQGARTAPRIIPSADVLASQDRRIALEQNRDDLRVRLRRVMDDRELLLKESSAVTGVSAALNQQQARLAVLGLLPAASTGTADTSASSNSSPPQNGASSANQNGGANTPDSSGDDDLDSHACPACGQHLDEPDPTAAALRNSLVQLNAQIGTITSARPAQRAALQSLDETAEELRQQLRVAQGALEDLMRGDRVSEGSAADNQDFTRGRIDAILSRATLTDDTALAALRARVETAYASVASLEAELNDDNDREELTSRLVAISHDMTTYAERLNLEHSGSNVRLDLARLTVVTDTARGPIPLFRIGSAENWIGYHLVAHLALHRYLTQQGRPVPRLLMLDQPTQAHYPSDRDNASGQPTDDADRIAVRAMFELIRDVVAELAPDFQVIVCDHADLPEQWFQDAVRHRWRDGVKLIPQEWITT